MLLEEKTEKKILAALQGIEESLIRIAAISNQLGGKAAFKGR